MAVKLPTREDLGQLETPRAGGPIASYRVPTGAPAAIQGAANSLARGVSAAGEAAKAIGEYRDKQEMFGLELKFQEFSWNQRVALTEAMRNIKPGEAPTFADNFEKTYRESARTFLESVPEKFQNEVARKLYSTQRDLHRSAFSFGYKQQDTESVTALNENLTRATLPEARATTTENLPAVAERWNKTVDLSTLPEPLKEELKRDGRRKIQVSHLSSLSPEQFAKLQGGRYGDAIASIESGGRYD